MDSIDPRSRDDDRSVPRPPLPNTTPLINGVYNHPGISASGGDTGGIASGYTLMVAGRCSGKTSFLRLLLDTSDISTSATKEQLASVAKFVQGCNAHTSHIRTTSVDIELDDDTKGFPQRCTLSLIDTPSIDFDDENAAERVVSDTLRLIDARFVEGMEDVGPILLSLVRALIRTTGLGYPGWR
jgi:hypothetical protein